MENVSYSVHCDKYQKRKDGTSGLYIRITIYRKSHYLRLGKFINNEHFDFEKNRVKNVKAVPNAKNINRFLSAQEFIVEDIILDLQRRDRAITFDSIKREFLGGGTDNFIEFCLNMLEEDSIDLKEETIKLDKYRFTKIERYHPNLSIREIDETWLKKYKKYLLEEIGNKPNTVNGSFRTIRKYIRKAIKQGKIKRNPFDNFTAPRSESDKAYLTIEEQHVALAFYKSKKLLKLLKEDKRGKTYQVGRKYQDILQHFLIACFCGLRLSDIASLRKHHIDLQNGVIVKRMIKGLKNKEKIVRIPLTDQLRQVLDLNRNDDRVYSGFVRIKSVWDLNKWLREILDDHVKICKGKHITFHCSRHSFAITCLTLGMPLETVQDVMGHSDIKTTQIYAKVVEEKRHKDMHQYWGRFDAMKPDNVPTTRLLRVV